MGASPSAAPDGPQPLLATNPPSRKGYTPGRLILGALIVVAVQLVTVASAAGVVPIATAPQIDFMGGTALEGCLVNSTAMGLLSYQVIFHNIQGPSGYAVMGLGINHRLARFWAVYVPVGAWDQMENGSVPVRCGTVTSSGLVLVTTVAS